LLRTLGTTQTPKAITINMSANISANNSASSASSAEAKQSKLSAKYLKQQVFAFWLLNKLAECDVFPRDSVQVALRNIALFEGVDAQIAVLSAFDNDVKETTKLMRKAVRDFHKPPKPTKATKARNSVATPADDSCVSDALTTQPKRGRKKKATEVVIESNDSIIQQLVHAANSIVSDSLSSSLPVASAANETEPESVASAANETEPVVSAATETEPEQSKKQRKPRAKKNAEPLVVAASVPEPEPVVLSVPQPVPEPEPVVVSVPQPQPVTEPEPEQAKKQRKPRAKKTVEPVVVSDPVPSVPSVTETVVVEDTKKQRKPRAKSPKNTVETVVTSVTETVPSVPSVPSVAETVAVEDTKKQRKPRAKSPKNTVETVVTSVPSVTESVPSVTESQPAPLPEPEPVASVTVPLETVIPSSEDEHDDDDDDDEEQEINAREIIFKGVTYLLDLDDNSVYDSSSHDLIGHFDHLANIIVFP